MDEEYLKKVHLVADKARETFLNIRGLRKTTPQFTRAQKDELTRKEKGLQDQWWKDVKGYMGKESNLGGGDDHG